MAIIGIDAGGTKTKFVCYDDAGNRLKEVQLPSCHILQNSELKVLQILKDGVKQVAPNMEVTYICIGMAGYGSDQTMRNRIEHVCEKAFRPVPYVIKNDAQIAMAGALDGSDGILVIAGTGSIAYSTQNGMERRCGGWGHQLDDAGSAYWIAKRLLECFVRQSDGRDEKTLLYEHVRTSCKLANDYDLITYVNTTLSGQRDQIAKLAMLVFELANKQEPNALLIYQEAAKHIAELILCLAKPFEAEVHVSYIGGVFQSKHCILEPLRNDLPNHIKLHEPIFPPEYGAYLIAKKKQPVKRF